MASFLNNQAAKSKPKLQLINSEEIATDAFPAIVLNPYIFLFRKVQFEDNCAVSFSDYIITGRFPF